MDRPYVEWVRVENYRCIRSVDVRLTRLHAFIGPNDSGKSSLLRAILTGVARTWLSEPGVVLFRGGVLAGTYPELSRKVDPSVRHAHQGMLSRSILRLEPDELRHATPLIPRGNSLWFTNEKGRGLPSLYDALLSRDVPGFVEISNRFRELFPTVAALRLENADEQTKTMAMTLVDGASVGPAEMSEGMLYWLAFAILEKLERPAMLLVEEPENGLHPARIREVVRILRELSAYTQILIATHSPLLINELLPEEVTIVTRTAERGTICTPMTATKNFAERSKVYALGELWVSYADGDLEEALVGGPDPEAKAG